MINEMSASIDKVNGLIVCVECPGPTNCEWALCAEMPPDEDSKCCFYDYGCRNSDRLAAGARALARKLVAYAKELEHEIDQ